ncbi:MAG: TIR domain-containing protein [Eubacteriales bacterium]|nr:TIR domain-containing protein [Eubacteriales bacterium]
MISITGATSTEEGGNVMKTIQDLRHFSSGIYEPYIFISYSHDDRDTVEKLVNRLLEDGFCVWVDYENIRGQYFSDDIKNGIRECAVFLQCLSRSYITKPYCEKEYKLADDENKGIVSVAIDDVRKIDNPNLFPYGGNIHGYGTGMRESFDEYYSHLMKSALLLKLKQGENPGYMFAGEQILTVLKEHCRRIYEHSGNYILHEIHKELFTDIWDEDSDEIYGGTESTEASLYNYLSRNKERNPVLLLGEGGTGKTVSMIHTCNQLLSEGICAVYVPLNKVWFDGTEDPVKEYIRKRILGEDETLFGSLKNMLNAEIPNNVFLFLDGANELKKQALDRLKEFLSDASISKEWTGTRIIISSRTDIDTNIAIRELKVLPLREENIEKYLCKLRVAIPDSKKVLELIQNPLMLGLYADAEKYAETYKKQGKEFKIQLDSQPDTAAKIIRNFMQTQLFQMASISNEDSNFILYHTLIDYALPAVAYRMLSADGLLTERMVRRILIDYLEEDELHFKWYSNEILEDLWWQYGVDNSYISKNDIRRICDFAIKNYRFLYINNAGEDEEATVEFLHQEFRDYFAGVFLANEIRMLDKARKYAAHGYSGLDICKPAISKDALEYCCGYLKEEAACPYITGQEYVFPGKREHEPSLYSVSEKVLYSLKRKTDESDAGVGNLIANLMQIMRCGRNNILAQCDFSDLDLRCCKMNGCHFSEYHMGKVYFSLFDHAIMNKSFFLNEGHAENVCVVAEGTDGWIYSADESGVLIRWNYQTSEMFFIKNYHDIPRDIVYDEQQNRLCIAFETQIVLMDCRNHKELYSRFNEAGTKYYRYVKFEADGQVRYAYDLEPFIWYDLFSGDEVPDNLPFSVVSGCAHEYSDAGKIIYSLFGRNVCVLNVEQLENNPRLVDYISENMKRLAGDLDDRNRERKPRLNAITADMGQECFTVAIGNQLLEYRICAHCNAKDFPLLRSFKFEANIQDVKYLRNGGVVLAAGKSVRVIDQKGNFINTLWKKSAADVVLFVQGCSDENSDVISESGQAADVFYLVSSECVIKKLDDQLNVTGIRKIDKSARFEWVRDRKTREIQMMFGPTKQFPDGYRMSFESGKIVPSGWCFEMMVTPNHRQIYAIGQMAVVYGENEDTLVCEYVNYSGIWIFGCSFQDVRGEMSGQDEQLLLKKNGGVINGASC